MDFYKAYAAVHNSDIRKEIDDVRDEISEMDFSLVSDAELIGIAEEVLLEVFEEGYTVDDAEAIFEEVIAEAKVTYGHDTDGARRNKIDKLKTSMKSAMGKAKEKAARGAVKSYAAYRSAKSSAEMSARRAGQSIKNKTAVAQRKASDNKSGIRAGLKSMVKKAAQTVGKVGAEVKKGYDKGMKKESYLETDMEKRKKNNEKARKDMKKMGSMKNPHFGDGPTGSMSSEEVEQVDEADSLAAMAARREKRLAAQRKKMGTSSTGQDFGHDYGISSAERKKRQQAEFDKFVGRGKKTKKEEVENVEELELDERTRYAKETGKDPQTGKPSEKGGTIKPGSAMSKVRKDLVGQGLMSTRKKAIQPQGQKKEKGAKGYEGQTPVDRIKAMVQKKRAPKSNPYGYGQGRNMGD